MIRGVAKALQQESLVPSGQVFTADYADFCAPVDGRPLWAVFREPEPPMCFRKPLYGPGPVVTSPAACWQGHARFCEDLVSS